MPIFMQLRGSWNDFDAKRMAVVATPLIVDSSRRVYLISCAIEVTTIIRAFSGDYGKLFLTGGVSRNEI